MKMMKYSRIITLLLGVAFALASCVQESAMEDVKLPSEGEAYASGEIFVKFSPSVEA